MTVAVTNAWSGPFSGNGTNKVFSFTFEAQATTEVGVTLAGVEQATGFTVVLNAGGAGGTVTFTAAPGNGVEVIPFSNPLFTQLIAFDNAGSYLPEVHDEALDRMATRLIYLKDRSDRSLRLPRGETAAAFPSAASRANKALTFDASGNPIASTVGGGGAPGTNGTNGTNAVNPSYTYAINTLSPGASATLAATGTYPNILLTFGIPKGDTGAGSSIAWGAITGTLSAQTDLQAALDAKQPLATRLTNLVAATYGSGTQILALTATNTWAVKTVGQAAGNILDKAAGDALYLTSASAAATYVTAASPTLTGTPLSTTAAAGTSTTQIATTAFVDRLRDIPAVAKTSTYQLLATDRGGTVSTTAAITIPSNVQVALGIGTVIEIYNNSASAITCTQGGTGTTTRKHGSATTSASVTLAAYSFGTLRKPSSATEWVAVGFS